MEPSAYIACFWVIAATIVAMIPMKHQYKPGVTLLIAAPVIIVWIGYDYGWVWAILGFAGFLSMFRKPLIYFYRRARGETPDIPK